MSLALSLKDILGCHGQSCPSRLCSDIFECLESRFSIAVSEYETPTG